MDKLEMRREFTQRFTRGGKLKREISPRGIMSFIEKHIDNNNPQQEILDYIKEQNGIVSNLINYIAQNTSPCEGIKPCSDELIKSRNINNDSIEPYLFKPLEDYYKTKTTE